MKKVLLRDDRTAILNKLINRWLDVSMEKVLSG